MLKFCPGGGFLYCWIDFETQLISSMHGDPQLEPIHHVMKSNPSILQGIASFSTNHGYVLG